jgi:type VI secretion system protein ImpJ
MFLRPHHFQAAQRYSFHLTHTSEKWDLHYNWGLRSVELDQEALANHRLVIRSLQARLRDGTLVSVPEDGPLPALDLRPAFDRGNAFTVLLAVPVLSVGRANVSDNGPAEGGRYLLDTQELEDENTGINPQPVQVRLLNLRLLLSDQDQSGYEVLPIARVEKSSRADAAPRLDITYIPPVLACDAWQPLAAGILQSVYDRIGRLMKDKAQQVVARGISLDSQAQGDAVILARLRAYNEAYALLGVLAFAQGVHPLPAYLELCRLVGQLAIFGETAVTPDLPAYDHDDLGGCFYRVRMYIDELLDRDQPLRYDERPFIGAGLRMQVALEPVWLESVYQILIGVQSALKPQECIDLLTRPGLLDMKVGSSQNVDEIFRRGQAGLRFTPTDRPPRALPTPPGLIYFQVNRESQQEEWQNVLSSLTLAVRLNENRIAGNIQGQRSLTIRLAGQTTPLQFTLYVTKGDG